MDKRSLDNELDLKLIDQLHAATLQISNFCFETKKLCISVLFAIITIILTVTDKKLDHFIFIMGFIIPFIFWITDAVGFYYQNKLRLKMNELRDRIINRSYNNNIVIVKNFYVYAYEKDYQFIKIFRSLFNNSMWLYYMLIFLDSIFWFCFSKGFIN